MRIAQDRKSKGPCGYCGFHFVMIVNNIMVVKKNNKQVGFERMYEERCARCKNLMYGSIRPLSEEEIGEIEQK